MSSCIALRQDIEVAKSELTAESNAKMKVMEESLASELAKISGRLDEIEKTLQIDKKAQENKINLSFSSLDELKATIRDINSRIDNVDLASQRSVEFANKISELENASKSLEEQLEHLKSEMYQQIDELKPVEKLTITENGVVRLSDNEEKSYNELVNFTKRGSDGAIARKGWEVFSSKWPKSRQCDVVYWIGESYYLEKSYNSAIEYFSKIEGGFKSCLKLEASYIRIAYSLHYTGKSDTALKILEAMQVKFPKTSFASQIKELKAMIPSGSSPKKQPAGQNEKKEK
ncbi:MAG: hypothetical protein ACOX2F_09715 [bacterium]